MNRTIRLLRILSAVLAVCLLLPAATLAQVNNAEQLKYPALPTWDVPKPTRVELDNGMVVILIEDHELALIDASARIFTGATLEPVDRLGLAGITGQVLRTGGTRNMSGDELDEWLEDRAAYIETGIGTDAGTAAAGSLKGDFPEVLKTFADVLRFPAFEADKIEVARTQAISGISRQNDNPMGIMFREFTEIIYGSDSPYSRSDTYETVNSITRDDLVAWHKEYYHPNRILLGIAGDFDTDEMLKLVRQTFGEWPRGSKFERPEVPYNNKVEPGVYYIEKNDMEQSDIIMGHLGIQKDNPDYYAAEVFNQILSDSVFASRLMKNVRTKKGLAYSVQGGINSSYDHLGTFNMWMTTKTETTAAGIDALFEEARNVTAQPPTDEEVDFGKAGILNSFVFQSDSVFKILNQQLTYEYYGYPLDWLQRYQQGIDKVKTADVQRVARDYVHPEQFAILVVGPSEGSDRPLTEFGEVALVDITIPEVATPEVEANTESLAKGAALIDRAVEGFGGADRVDSVRRIDHAGTTVVVLPQGEMPLQIKILKEFPDRMRQEVLTPQGLMTFVATPDAGFMETAMGVQRLPDAQRQDLLKEMIHDPLMVAKLRNQSGFRAIASGAAEVDGTAVENVVVEIVGESITLSIDPATGRTLMIAYHGKRPMVGTPGDMVRTFSDFREVDGLVVPFAAVGTWNGQPSDSATIDTLNVDGPMDETAFAMPAAESGEKDGK